MSYDKNDKGDVTEKQKPQFAKSFSKIICRIQTRIPICLEKHEYMAQLGRFTLRDEGKTIAVGKVLRYKPAKDMIIVGGAKEEKKAVAGGAQGEKSQVKETFYDMDTGEEISKEEHDRRKKERERADLAGINEDDEDDDEAQASK